MIQAACKQHDFEEIFNAAEVGHKPIKVCGKCKMGFSITEEKWFIPSEVDQIKSKLKYMKDRYVGK